MTMSTTTTYNAFIAAPREALGATNKPSFFARLVAAMMESRRRTAYREIARFEAIYGVDLGGKSLLKPLSSKDLPFQG
jgi:hypothetical protein